MLKHIMFDLDGTLLALGFDDFVKVYMKLLGGKMASLGYDGEQSVKAVWAGTYAMLKNDGTKSNHRVFWETFDTFGLGDVKTIEGLMDVFYTQEFTGVRSVLREERNLRKMVDGLKEKGYTLSLATNPIFPLVGVKERLAWLGLTAEDFAVVTSYENSRYCKPKPGYFEDVMKTAGFTPEESMMVGNDIHDDMPAAGLGVQVYLVTDVLENANGNSVDAYSHGTFAELLQYFEELPNIKG